MIRLIYAIVLVATITFLIGCKGRRIYVPIESSKTEYIDRWSKDSIYLHDSIFVERWNSNDTVFLTKEKYKYIYKDKVVIDSIFIRDSIQIPYPIVEFKEVNKLTGLQNFQVWCGRILLAISLGYLFLWKRL